MIGLDWVLNGLWLYRVVLMSATADISRYREYFKDLGRGERVEVLAIPPSTGKSIIYQRKVTYLEQVLHSMQCLWNYLSLPCYYFTWRSAGNLIAKHLLLSFPLKFWFLVYVTVNCFMFLIASDISVSAIVRSVEGLLDGWMRSLQWVLCD